MPADIKIVSLKDAVFKWGTRLSMRDYWRYFILPQFLMFAALFVLTLTSESFLMWSSNNFGLYGVMTFVSWIFIAAFCPGRLHDMNLPGWYLGFAFLAIALCFLGGAFMPASDETLLHISGYASAALQLVTWLLALLSGTDGFNRYGPPCRIDFGKK